MRFIFGVLVGVVICVLIFFVFMKRKKPSGTFVIDLSDPMNDDVCQLIMDEDLNEISSKSCILLNVKTYLDRSLK